MKKHSHYELIQSLYAAFDQKDGQAMADCYHEKATFSDPIFLELSGRQIGAMWSMLCFQAKTLEIKVSEVRANSSEGQAIWTARYDYGKPPRTVHNKIKAVFEFQEGKILRHEDRFSLWKWTHMALGPLGLILGWNSSVQDRIRKQAMRNLKKFISGTNNS